MRNCSELPGAEPPELPMDVPSDSPRIDAAIEWSSEHPLQAKLYAGATVVAATVALSYLQARGWVPLS